jgi:hypothetical protein
VVGLEVATFVEGRGIEGDRATRGKRGGKRQVTLIRGEDLPLIAERANVAKVHPAQLRRNLVVEGIAFDELEGVTVAIGSSVIVAITGPCDPCSKMNAAIGIGGHEAMLGRGGLTARVVRGGEARIGDSVRAIAAPTNASPPQAPRRPRQNARRLPSR